MPPDKRRHIMFLLGCWRSEIPAVRKIISCLISFSGEKIPLIEKIVYNGQELKEKNKLYMEKGTYDDCKTKSKEFYLYHSPSGWLQGTCISAN